MKIIIIDQVKSKSTAWHAWEFNGDKKRNVFTKMIKGEGLNGVSRVLKMLADKYQKENEL